MPNIRSPDAVQREAVHRRAGVFAVSAAQRWVFATIPGLQRTTLLRNVLRCDRETALRKRSLYFAAALALAMTSGGVA
jgi:hypothetical protein